MKKKEMDDAVQILEEKIRIYRPEATALVGKSIWESIFRAKHGRSIKKEEFQYGWQQETENLGTQVGDDWIGSRVFVAASTSGLAATLSPAEKQRIWNELGEWICIRREELGWKEDIDFLPGVCENLDTSAETDQIPQHEDND